MCVFIFFCFSSCEKRKKEIQKRKHECKQLRVWTKWILDAGMHLLAICMSDLSSYFEVFPFIHLGKITGVESV